jgi:hypothetical protein
MLWLEKLESRDCPSWLIGFRPHHMIVNGVQVTDIEQNQSATCAFDSGLASAVKQKLFTTDNLQELGLYKYRVWLHEPQTGNLRPIDLTFKGWVTQYDLSTKNGEFWTILVQRAYLKLVPQALLQGDSLERISYILTGHVPSYDDSPRHIGKLNIQQALTSGYIVIACTEEHAWAVLAIRDGNVILYNPWGFVQIMSWSNFVGRMAEVTIARM